MQGVGVYACRAGGSARVRDNTRPAAPALRMRIQFVSSDRPGVDWTGPNLRIGSGDGCDVLLNAAGVASMHAELRRESGALWLLVSRGASRVYVNARPVRECALVRAGDMLSLGGQRLLLCTDREPASAGTSEAREARHAEAATVALRVVAGPWSGRVWPVGDELLLNGSGQPLEASGSAEAALCVGWNRGRPQLETRSGTGGHAPSVNGLPVKQAALRNGDCIGLGPHRFVVDAWGLEPDPDALPPRQAPPAEPLPEDRAGPRGEVWWLILTAAVLALLIALFLVMHP